MPHHEGPRRFLLICKGQKLDSKLTHHVAVERDKVRDPKAVENREQQQWIFRRFSERFSLLDQQTCPLHGRPGFQRRVAADMEEWGYECNLKLDFFATQGGRGGQGCDLVERTPELFGGLNKRRALRRPQSGFAPKCCGFLDLPRLGAVTRQQLGLVLGDLRELTFEGFGDSGMKRPSRLAQQRAVSRIPYQYMLEKVGRVRRATLPAQQTSPNETVKRRSQLRLRLAHDRNQQRMGELASDRRPDLRQLLGGAEPVEPRHQRCVQACGDRQCRRRNQGGGPPCFAFALCLQHRLRHFFHEQGDAVRALDDIVSYVRRQRIVADDVLDDGADFAGRQPIEAEEGHVRLSYPARLEFRPEGYDQQRA